MIQMIGSGRLKEIVMAALPVGAEEAHQIGLVNRVSFLKIISERIGDAAQPRSEWR
jgi:enoyl-CoA hydratase/carnithine racemase